MAVAKDVVAKKALGLAQSIEKMTEKERDTRPTVAFGEDYNRLRQLALEAAPELEPALPPAVGFDEYGVVSAERQCSHKYKEILAFASEIYQLVA